jgi:hypothetical protein
MSSFSYKLTTEIELFNFNFSGALGSSETITSANCVVEVKDGVDASPSSILSGSPSISGSVVTQKITGGLNGVTYRVEMSATSNTGNVYTIVGDIPVLSPIKAS